MNERIKELSNIAYMNHVERNPHSSFGRRYDYDKEFAELIVRECAQVGFDYADGHCCEISAVILEHFGVEE
jgi:hypothetical protein